MAGTDKCHMQKCQESETTLVGTIFIYWLYLCTMIFILDKYLEAFNFSEIHTNFSQGVGTNIKSRASFSSIDIT